MQQATQDKAVKSNADYLKSKGWRDKGDGTFIDPKTGGKEKLIDTGRTIKQGGKTVPLKQTSVPSAPWSYPEDQAVAMQQERDGKTK